MKTRRVDIICATLLLLLIVGCGKKSPTPLHYIPASADMVVTMQMAQLSEKMNFDSIKQNSALSFAGGILAMQGIPNFIDDRSVTGIDFDKNMTLFMETGSDVEGSGTGGMAFYIADEEKMKQFLTKVAKEQKIQSNEQLSYLTTGEIVLGWKDNIGLLLFNPNDRQSPDAILNQHFNLPEASAMAGSEMANHLTENSHDIAILTSRQLLAQHEGQEVSGHFLSAIDFLQGEIRLLTQLKTSPEEMESFAQMVNPAFPDAIASAGPVSAYPAHFAMRLDGPGVHRWLASNGVYDYLEKENPENAAQIALVKQLMPALGGQLFVGYHGLDTMHMIPATALTAEEEAVHAENTPMPEPMWYLAATLHDASAVRPLLDSLVADSVMMKKAGYYQGLASAENLNPGIVVIRDKVLYITTTNSWFDHFIAGKDGLPASGISKNMGKKVIHGFIDADALSRQLEGNLPGQGGMASVVKAVFGPLSSIEMYGNPPGDDTWEGQVILTYKNQDKNALQVMMSSLVTSISNLGMMQL